MHFHAGGEQVMLPTEQDADKTHGFRGEHTRGWVTPPEESRRALAVPWTTRDAALGIALTIVPLVTLLIAGQILASGAPTHSVARLTPARDLTNAIAIAVSSSLVEAVFLIAPVYYAIKRRPAGASRWAGIRVLGLRGFQLGSATVTFVAGLALVYGFTILYSLLRIQTNADALARQAAQAPYTTVATLLVAVVVAPICEELFFRGFAFPALAQAMPLWGAILATSLIFGVTHADIGSFAPLVVIGVALAVLRWRTGSIWPGVAFHAFNNAVAAVYIFSVIHA